MHTKTSRLGNKGPNRQDVGDKGCSRTFGETQQVRPGFLCGGPRVPSLHHVMEESMSVMGPGDVLLLEGTASLREFVDPVFYAILACPLCGKLDLITQRQYSGTEPVICAHNDCSCHFRIDQRHRLAYLPMN